LQTMKYLAVLLCAVLWFLAFFPTTVWGFIEGVPNERNL